MTETANKNNNNNADDHQQSVVVSEMDCADDCCSARSSNNGHNRTDRMLPGKEGRTESLVSLSAPSSNNNSNQKSSPPPPSSSSSSVSLWTRFTLWLHYGISQFVLTLSLCAARNPKRCIGLVSAISIALLVTGLSTNFNVDVNEEEIFAPLHGASRIYSEDYRNIKGFPRASRPMILMIHADGGSVVSYDAMDRLFRAVEVVRSTPGYDEICSYTAPRIVSGEEEDKDAPTTCRINGLTRWWYNNYTRFQEETQGSDEAVQAAISQATFPGGTPAFAELMMGSVERNQYGLINFTTSFFMGIEFPGVGDKDEDTAALELRVIERLLDLREEWANEPDNQYKFEFHAIRSVSDELMRAITNDIPLIPFVFIIMTAFTCLIFYRRDQVQSRALLGLGSVVTIVCSIMTGYGIIFIAGVPFTSMTQILPFVVFGVGLDDTFIITGAYLRTNANLDPVERIRETVEEVANSISLTTITTAVAFILGCLSSSIPSIRWLCIYAFTTIVIDFIYQITFFIAILVLDERRVQANRRDCCFCYVVPALSPSSIMSDSATNGNKDIGDDEENTATASMAPSTPPRPRAQTEDVDFSEGNTASAAVAIMSPTSSSFSSSSSKPQQAPVVDRFMDWYADRLLRPAVKVFVLIAFAIFLGGCAYSATQLKQSFKASDFMPQISYSVDFLDALNLYYDQSMRFPAIFRYVDQSDPQVQEAMMDYVADLVELPAYGAEPDACWVRDFQKLKNGELEEYAQYSWIFNGNLTFNDQLALALSIPEINEIYGSDIALDEDGNIEASRCWLSVKHLDLDIVKDQINLLADIYRVNAAQPTNLGHKPGKEPFFSFDLIFFLWEFYTVAVNELKFNTISGIVAVAIIGFLLIPHWSAVLFVAPLIIVLYVDLLGTLQFSGIFINPLTYVCLVLSIGLLVDFLMHVILRYFESTESTRENKVKDTLRTMGSSILVGALSTCLGVIPLAFSSSGILKTVFVSFTAMVTLGIGHGLILLPVLLSFVGPEVCVRMNHQELVKELNLDASDDQEASQLAMAEESRHPSESCTLDFEDTDDGAMNVSQTLEDGESVSSSSLSTPGYPTAAVAPRSSSAGSCTSPDVQLLPSTSEESTEDEIWI